MKYKHIQSAIQTTSVQKSILAAHKLFLTILIFCFLIFTEIGFISINLFLFTMIDNSELYAKFLKKFSTKWENCSEDFPCSKRKFSAIEKYLWELKCDRFISSISEQKKLKRVDSTEIINESRKFFRDGLSYSNNQLEMIFSADMISATKEFVKKSILFDKNMESKDLFQALRNMWIVMGLQSLWGQKICITPSTLAYSLLYPYTDNYIDNSNISKSDKLNFSERFAKRLAGDCLEPANENEAKIFQLLAMIENEYERTKFPKVYESLLDIHHAQTQSIELCNKNLILSNKACFTIAVNKGATSVIADGYLIMGNLSKEQLHFLYEYGAYLQIIDDLQDASEDYKEGVYTSFSRLLPHKKLDRMLCKTYYLGEKVVETIQQYYSDNLAFQGLIKRSFALLFASAIIANPENFSSHFIDTVEKHSPFRFSFANKQMNNISDFKDLMEKKFMEWKKSEIYQES